MSTREPVPASLLRPEANSDAADDEISLIEVANAVLRWRRLLVLVPLAFAFIAGFVMLTRTRTWTATASFVPHTSRPSATPLAGVAAEFGIRLPGGQAGESPAFYEELIRSTAILGALAEERFDFVQDGERRAGTALDLLQVEGETPEARRDAAVRQLRDDISASTSRETDIVRLSVRAEWPVFAQLMAERVLELLHHFNLETRQSQARAERVFVEERLRLAREELVASEERLRLFLERNRQWTGSAELQLLHERLQWDVGMRQQVVTSLAEAYERARIEEVRNIPLVTEIEHPALPVRPDSRGTVRMAAAGFLGGLVLAVVVVLTAELFRQKGTRGSRERDEFQRLSREALEDVRRPWRMLKGRRASAERPHAVARPPL